MCPSLEYPPQQRLTLTTPNGAAARATRALVLFRAVLGDEPGQALLALLDALQDPCPDGDAVRQAYARLFSTLAEERELDTAALAGNACQAHLLRRLLHDENPFSRKAQVAPFSSLGPALVEQARRDLRRLQALYSLDVEDLAARAAEACGEAEPFPSLSGLAPLRVAPLPPVVQTLLESETGPSR